MREGFKLDVPHSEHCRLVNDPAPFRITATPPRDWHRRRNGVHGGSTLWWRFCCNDPSCSAILLVRGDVLADWIGRG